MPYADKNGEHYKAWLERNNAKRRAARKGPEELAKAAAAMREWTAKNKERLNAARREKLKDPKWKEHLSERRRLYRLTRPARDMFVNARNRARRFGLPFDIVEADIVVPEKCPVFGTYLIFGEGRWCDESPTLDKIVPEKGYVKGNIVVISWRANRIKNNASPDELRKLADFYSQFKGAT